MTSDPNHIPKYTVLKACANVVCAENDYDEFVERVFTDCCKAGQVSFGVCFQLKHASSHDLYRKLIPASAFNETNGHFSIKDMPFEWTRNVRERQARDSIGRNKKRSKS